MKHFAFGCFLLVFATSCTHRKMAMTPITVAGTEIYIDGGERIDSAVQPLKAIAVEKMDSTIYYRWALAELKAMLEGSQPLNFKRAVFLTENAYFDNRMVYADFDSAIQHYASICRNLASYNRLKNYHHWKDSAQIAKNEAIYSFMMRPIVLSAKLPLLLRPAYRYDFEDCFGEKDWTKTFVTKLMMTNSGTCRSLPFLYKILAGELATDASLALAPNHIYLKQNCQKYNGYNTELTNGLFPIDGWIMTAGYVPLETMQKGVYLKKLTERQSIAVCLYDLAEGFRHRFHTDTASFIIKCLDAALVEHPKYIDALQLKGRTYASTLASSQVVSLADMRKDKKLRSVFMKMQEAYATIADLGYREMPEKMYREWLAAMENEKGKYIPSNPIIRQGDHPGAYFGQIDSSADARRPFKEWGVKTAKMVSLSGGRYNEFIDYDSLVAIDNITVSRNTHSIVSYENGALRPAGSSRWMSPDPLAQKFASVSPYMSLGDNPIIFIDPNGMENKYALAWMRANLIHQGIKDDNTPWYGKPGESHSGSYYFDPNVTHPDHLVCYEACWMSYMQGGAKMREYFENTGFAGQGGLFMGRSSDDGGMNWFKEGSKEGGKEREFITDIKGAELGDILFEGESGGNRGHAVLVNGPIVPGETVREGKTLKTMTVEVLSTPWEEGGQYDKRTFSYIENEAGGWTNMDNGHAFRGYGQMHNTEELQDKKQNAASCLPDKDNLK